MSGDFERVTMKRTEILTIVVLALGLMVCHATVCNAIPMGTVFTYQGRLIDANAAADGDYDFKFKLFNADSGGSQVGSDVSKDDVKVMDGYFTVELDFGNVFTAEARWLEIGVREGTSNGTFTTLIPRQKVTPAPYAINTIVPSGTTSVVTGNFQSNGAPIPYPIEIDLSSLGNISPEDVTIVASAFKYDYSLLFPPPVYQAAFVRWEVTGPPLAATLRVYDKEGFEYYQDGPAWINRELSLSFIAAGPGGGSGILRGSKAVGGRILGTPPATYPFEFDISGLGNVQESDVMVVASGSKLSSIGEPEMPLMIRWDVNDSPLTVKFRVWDSYGEQYSPASGAWMGKQMEMSFAAFDPNGYSTLSGDNVLSGKFEYTVNNTPTMPFEIPISGLDVDDVSSINVLVSGIRHEVGGKVTLLSVKAALVDSSGLKLHLWVWDVNGDEPDDNNPEWDGKTLEVSYAIIGPAGGSAGTAADVKVVMDLNLDSSGNIVTGAIPQEDYYGRVTRLYLRDLPNLKERLGGSGISLAAVNNSVKKLMLSAQTYSENTQDTFVGFRWARVNSSAVGTNEADIYWPIKICEDIAEATEDTDATYKLIRVEAHLN